MSSDASGPFDAPNKPKVDKFAALAAAQQQKATSGNTEPLIQSDLQNVGESDMLLGQDEPTPNELRDVTESSVAERPLESTSAKPHQQQQQQQIPQPPRRDKFASMAAAAAESSLSLSVGDGDGNTSNHTIAQRTVGNGKFAAALMQKQAEDQNQQRKRCLELCTQRDSIWNDCDAAEHAVTDLLKYAEQTATILSKNTSCIDPDAYSQSKVRLSKVINDYQSTVVQVHDLLSKHAHHVQAYHSNAQRHGETIRNTGTNSGSSSTSATAARNGVYTQRVEHRLAETKRQLLQNLLTLMKEENEDSNASTDKAT